MSEPSQQPPEAETVLKSWASLNTEERPALPPPPPAGAGGLPQVPGYETLAVLGQGGMGVVYQARHHKLQRLVALKMVRGAAAGPEDLLRLRTEAEAIARLQHANIVQIFEVGAYQGLPFLALEFCPGGALDRKLAGTPLPPREAAALLETLARAMHAAHAKGVVHRDLKPANVLLAEDGTPKITDFGLARKLDEAGQTAAGAVLGTPSYMAPEQARGQGRPPGPACDIYALGAILYDCLTGRPPFKAATAVETVLQVLEAEPVPPAQLNRRVPRDLETICLKCLEKAPHQRYQSALYLAEDLRRFLAGEPIRARPVGRMERAAKWVRRNPVVAALLAAVALALTGGAAASAVLAVRANGAAEQAEQNADRADAEKRAAQQSERITLAALAETEEALADGLLRPLGHWNGPANPVTAVELVALWELASLPAARDRVRRLFVDRALLSASRAEQLENCLGPALQAAVGLDRRQAEAVRRLLVHRLRDPGTVLRVKRTALLALQELDLLDDESAREAAALAADLERLLGVEGRTVTVEFWAAVGGHLPAEQARQLDDRVATWLVALSRQPANAPDSFPVSETTTRLTPIGARLSSGQAQALASRLVGGMQDTEDPVALAALARGLAAVSGRLPPAAAEQFHDRAAARLIALWEVGPPAHALTPLAQGLLALGPKLSAASAKATAGQLLRLTDGMQAQAVFRLAKELAAFTAGLPEGQAHAVHDRVAERLLQLLGDDRVPNSSVDRLYSGVVLEALSPRLSVAGARAAAQGLLKAVNAPKTDPTLVAFYSHGLAAVSVRLPPDQASLMCDQAAHRLVAEVRAMPGAKRVLGGIGGPHWGPEEWAAAAAEKLRERLTPAQSEALAVLLAGALEIPAEAAQLQTLTRLFGVFAAKADDARARQLHDRVVSQLLVPLEKNERLKVAITGPGYYSDFHWICRALHPICGKLSPAAAGPVAERLLAILEQKADACAAEGPGPANPGFLSLTRLEVMGVGYCLAEVLARVPAPQAERLHNRAAERLLGLLDPNEREPLRGNVLHAVAALSARLPKDQGTRLLDRVAGRLAAPGEAESRPARKRQVGFLLAAGDRLPARWAAATAATLVDNLSSYQENDEGALTPGGMIGNPGREQVVGLTVKAFRPLTEVCTHLDRETTVRLLRHPLCAGRTRRVLLNHLGKLLGQPGGSRWELLAVLQRRHPEIDLTGVPARPADDWIADGLNSAFQAGFVGPATGF